MSSFEFPPYGEMDRGYIEGINPRALAPAAWRPNLSAEERETTWIEWRGETLRLINKTLWPQWDPEANTWIDPNFEAMRSLTERDFSLFHEQLADDILHSRPDTPVSSAAIPNHFDFFQDEDSGSLGVRYNYYDITLPVLQLNSISSYKGVLA